MSAYANAASKNNGIKEASCLAIDPDLLTTAARKAKRGDRVYLDVARNAYAQTAVPPFAVPEIRPLNCLRNLVFFGCSMVLALP